MRLFFSGNKRRNILAIILFSVILLVGITAYAQEPYSTSSELICDNIKVQVITKSIKDPKIDYINPNCTEQHFIFIDQETGKAITKSASGKLVDVIGAKGRIIGRWLDSLATELYCVKGKTESYLIFWYNTGGNCDECEWQELLDLKGKRLASTRHKTKRNMNAFSNIWKQLGIPDMQPGGKVPGSSHIDIL